MKSNLGPIRRREGVTKQGLASASGACVGTITNAENGKPVRQESMARICKGLNRLIRQ